MEAVQDCGPGTSELGSGCRGRGLSSRENIDRSSPFHRSPHSWLFCQLSAGSFRYRHGNTYSAHVHPESVAVATTSLQGEMISIHGRRLTGKVSSLISIFIIHIIWNPYLSKYAGMISHIVHALFSDAGKLVSKTVSDGSFTHLHCKSRREVFAAQESKNIYIPVSIPNLPG